MKNFKYFENETTYNGQRSGNYEEPWVSWTVGKGLNWNKNEEEIINTYLTFNILTSGTVLWTYSYLQKTISYSLNGSSWTSLTPTTAINVNAGDVIMFKGENSTYSRGDGRSKFEGTATFNVSGNIMSLVYGDNFANATTLTDPYTFDQLFKSAKIVSSKYLVLPATTLTTHCYRSMFASCTLMIDTPKTLPATALTDYCYESMFSGCNNITTVPKIFGETFAINSCSGMFNRCTGLTSVPSIFPNARTMAQNSCSTMFSYCSNLTVAPELPATTMGESCYYYMFRDCTSLTSTPELPAMTLATNCYKTMFSGCSSIVTAHDLPATELAVSCYDNMFISCTSLVNAPKLPATTLVTKCYYMMFYNCKSLTTAPDLPATTLVNSCYEGMFYSCSSLNYVKCTATSISASRCLMSWLRNVAETGTFVKAAGVDNWPTGESGIPSGWTVQTATE